MYIWWGLVCIWSVSSILGVQNVCCICFNLGGTDLASISAILGVGVLFKFGKFVAFSEFSFVLCTTDLVHLFHFWDVDHYFGSFRFFAIIFFCHLFHFWETDLASISANLDFGGSNIFTTILGESDLASLPYLLTTSLAHLVAFGGNQTWHKSWLLWGLGFFNSIFGAFVSFRGNRILCRSLSGVQVFTTNLVCWIYFGETPLLTSHLVRLFQFGEPDLALISAILGVGVYSHPIW